MAVQPIPEQQPEITTLDWQMPNPGEPRPRRMLQRPKEVAERNCLSLAYLTSTPDGKGLSGKVMAAERTRSARARWRKAAPMPAAPIM